MIAIIAEKPSVGQDIARVVGATEKMDGYITGNGYMVTWALGHLVSLALPGTYGYTRTTAEDLPMIPEPFRLVPRQIRTDRGMVTDIAAGKQLKIIDEVSSKCDSIIVATDAGREGELIFRWIYSYLGYTKPFRRLWISSLTDEAIREGMANLREGSGYDSLYAAADSRAKADWLIGMNASRAYSLVYNARFTVGRVQTPTLAMIVDRDRDITGHVARPYWKVVAPMGGWKLAGERLDRREDAETLLRIVNSDDFAFMILAAGRKQQHDAPPRLVRPDRIAEGHEQTVRPDRRPHPGRLAIPV